MLKIGSIIMIIGTLYCPIVGLGQRLIDIDKVSFSSKEADFCPVFYGDSLVFCSRRGEGKTLTDLYITRPSGDDYSNTTVFAKELNTPYHDGPATFSADGKTMYFSKNYETGVKKRNNQEELRVGIFKSTLENGRWTPPTPFKLNDIEHTFWHPSLSENGQRLYFSSDMEGGMGKFDIWYVEQNDDGWGDPVNPGPTINSERSEVYPYAHSSGRLYYSSNGGNVLGGMDIFFTQYVDSAWEEPVRAPEPINSDADDFGIILAKDLMSGFFTSSRKREDQIFRFQMNFPEVEECDTISPSYLCATFYEAGPEEGEESPHFGFEWDFGDGSTARGLEVKHCFKEAGTYQVTLSVIDSIARADKEVIAEYEYEIPEVQGLYVDCANKCTTDKPVKFSSDRSNVKDFRIDEYFWNLDNKRKIAGKYIQHSFDKPGTYYIKIIATQVDNKRSKYDARCAVRKVVIK